MLLLWPGWNGKLVFVSDRAPNLQNEELYVVGSDGRGAAPLAGVTSLADEFDPAWSPEGRRLAFASTRTGDTEIFVRDETGAVTQLTHAPGVDRFPAWSPDGRRIVFATNRRGTGASEIYVVDASDGAALTRVTTNETTPSPNPNIPRPGDVEPAWSSDGSLIAYARIASPGAGIRVVRPDGSGDRGLTSIGGQASTQVDRSPAWSPDGRRLAFARGDALAPASALWLIDADGSDAHALTDGAGYESGPAWSPAGDSIAFVRSGVLAVARPDGSGLRVIARAVAGRPAGPPTEHALPTRAGSCRARSACSRSTGTGLSPGSGMTTAWRADSFPPGRPTAPSSPSSALWGDSSSCAPTGRGDGPSRAFRSSSALPGRRTAAGSPSGAGAICSRSSPRAEDCAASRAPSGRKVSRPGLPTAVTSPSPRPAESG